MFKAMPPGPGLILVVSLSLLLLSNPADAFRCKSRIVRDGMHEAEVIRLCGEPVSMRELGVVVRPLRQNRRSMLSYSRRNRNHNSYYQTEVRVTEMVFNFGPRRLMRKVRFEGGLVASIRTMGYGYLKQR